MLVRDYDCVRNNWHIGLIEKTFPSEDCKVRKVQVRIVRDGKVSTYIRPITELVVLLEAE